MLLPDFFQILHAPMHSLVMAPGEHPPYTGLDNLGDLLLALFLKRRFRPIAAKNLPLYYCTTAPAALHLGTGQNHGVHAAHHNSVHRLNRKESRGGNDQVTLLAAFFAAIGGMDCLKAGHSSPTGAYSWN